MANASDYSDTSDSDTEEIQADISDDDLDISIEGDEATDDDDDGGSTSSNSIVDENSDDSMDFFKFLRFRNVDFTDMLSTANPCVISGDGFLLEIINYRYLNKDLGGQTLPIIYLLEQFLREIERLGGTGKIVWFKDMKNLYRYNKMVHFMYSVLRSHSKLYLNSIELNNPVNGEWFNYLSNNRPPFIFMLMTTDSLKTYFSTDIANNIKDCFACIIYFAFQNYTPIINISGLRKSLTKIEGYFGEEHPFVNFPTLGFDADYFVKLWQKNAQVESSCANLFQTFDTTDEFWINVLHTFQQEMHENFQEATQYLQVFVLYLTCLKKLPLNSRCFVTPVLLDNKTKNKMEIFICTIMEIASNLLLSSRIKFATADLFDGKLLLNVYCNFDDLITVITNDTPWYNKYCELLALNMLPAVSRAQHQTFLKILPLLNDEYNNDVREIECKFQFSDNRFFQSYFENNFPALDLVVMCKKPVLTLNKFFEDYHWHSGKLLSDDLLNKPKQNKDKKEAKKENKDKQNYKKWVHFYGNSLEGLETKSALKRVNNPVNKTICSPQTTENDKVESKTSKKEKKLMKQSNHSKEIAARNAKKQAEKKKIEEKSRFESRIGAKNLSLSSKLSIVQDCLLKSEFPETKAVILFCQFKLLLEKVNSDRISPDSLKGGNVILLVENVKRITSVYLNFINEKEKMFIAKLLLGFGFEVDVINNLELITDISQLSCITIDDSLNLNINFYDYQLKFGGHLFEIQENPQPDSRVPHFVPDKWQVKLLDIVDENKSALIVAPTSAGKTFISYYCIEKIINETDDGIVVYVSPTKALVNQVAATIYARLGKLDLKAGQAVCGVFTRDYRTDVLNCRVLVTVPQCFEILLLSPERLKWKSKIQYVIFDEVHCIGHNIGDSTSTEVWEHIILLNQSPFLALSATVSNPETLQRWLTLAESLKRNQGSRYALISTCSKKPISVELIEESERIAEFEMLLYDHKENQLEKLHPFSTLQLQNAKSFDILSDIQLTSEQCLDLYCALDNRHCQNLVKAADYFSNMTWLRRSDLRRFEATLKGQFYNIIETDIHEAALVMSELNSGVKETNFMKRTVKSFAERTLLRNIVPFVKQLQSSDKLPCLLFSDNRGLCEDMAMRLSSFVRFSERRFLRLPCNRNKIVKYLNDVKEYKKLKQRVREVRDEKPGTEEECCLSLPENPFIEDLKKFSFRKPNMNANLLEKLKNRLYFKHGKNESTIAFYNCLKRGIGYHHSGLSIIMRQCVEILFRAGLLGLVFSTQTLALGINMPCRTVVFCFDSPYLNSLAFRQMSGRAGRRGFDNKGNIIFYGIPSQKIVRLICSKLPCLKGNIPFKTSFVLRLLVLAWQTQKCNNEEDIKPIIDQCIACLKCPLYGENLSPIDKACFMKQIGNYFEFCLKMLLFLNLIDNVGHPIGLAGIATHLHYREPGNLIFIYFVQRGLFHELCKCYSGDELLEQILVVLCTIFTSVYIPSWNTRKRFTNSKVLLEPLPKKFSDSITEYNEIVKQIFLKNLLTYSQQISETYYTLPISNVKFSISESEETIAPASAKVIDSIGKTFCCFTPSIINPCIAITGTKDIDVDFLNTDFFSPLKEGFYFDKNFLPSVPYPVVDHWGNTWNRNAYALDFYRHQIPSALHRDNGLMEGDVYNLLNDFMLTIKAISVSLNHLAEESDPVVKAFNLLSENYSYHFNTIYGKHILPHYYVSKATRAHSKKFESNYEKRYVKQLVASRQY